MKKPSKKIIILILCAVIFITAVAYNKFHKSKSDISFAVVTTPELKPETVNTDTPLALLDTDKDGLPDWQETITGTDPKNPDTDGDGTSDGKELELGRNPTIAGPDDKNNGGIVATTTKATDAETISESVARNLFANTVYLSNTDNLNEDTTNALINDLISGVQKAFTYKEYTGEGLGSISNENKETIAFYASGIAAIQKDMILQMQKNIKKIEVDVGVLGGIFAKQANDLYALKVPRALKTNHLAIVNNYSRLASVFEAISNEKKDPLKLPFAMRTYQTVLSEQNGLMANVLQFIKDNDIILSTDVAKFWNDFEQN